MTNNHPPSPAESLLVLHSLLDGLLQWLQPGAPEGCDPGHLETLLEEAQHQASSAGLYGVSALMRIWASAMAQRRRAQSPLNEGEKGLLHTWFSKLRCYCEGALDERGQIELLDQLAVVPSLAAVPPKLYIYLRDRLVETQPYLRTLIAELEQRFLVDDDVPSLLQDSLPKSNEVTDDSAAYPPIADEGAGIAAGSDMDVWPSSAGQDAIAEAPNLLAGSDEVWVVELPVFDSTASAGHALPAIEKAAAEPEDVFRLPIIEVEDKPFSGAMFEDPTTRLHPADGDRSDPVESPAADMIDAAPELLDTSEQATIWISPEELQLALDAVSNQILPSVIALAQNPDADAHATLMADLEFNLGLVGNAMEMLGTPALSRGILAMQACVADAAMPAVDDLANWSAALMAFLEQPDAENTDVLSAFSAIAPNLDEIWADALQREAARIRFGIDPALVASRKIAASGEDIALDIAPDVLPSVLDGMLRELPGNAERLGNAMRRLIATGDPAPIEEARRISHTLKGDANTVGIRGLANLAHTLEDLLMDLYKHPEKLVPELGEALDNAADCVEEIADFLLARGPAPDNVFSVYQSMLDWSNALHAGTMPTVLSPASEAAGASVAPIAPTMAATLEEPVAAAIGEVPQARTATLTVAADLLDELQRLAGETLVMARQIDQRLALMESMHREQVAEVRNASNLLGKLDDLISLRGAALQSTALRGGSEVDPLELDQYNELHVVSRRLLESNADNNEYQRRLDVMLVELESLRSQQEAVHADLQRTVQRARTVPFEQISGRLQRIVRQTARQLDRQVDLQVIGERTLLDADLLDRIVEPLGHLLRNAIDHGLETADERQFAGKAETGIIQVAVRTVADSIEIQVKDDGRGLDYDAIRSKAFALGLHSEDRELSDSELSQLILTPGFTTRREATQVSGRGIGMDVVNQRIIDLRGQLALNSIPGQGLTVTMRLPVSQTMANVIIAYGQGLIMGAVAGSVERVHNFAAEELMRSDDGQLRLKIDGEAIPIFPIESLYGRSEGRVSLPTSSGLGLIVRSSRGRRMLISVTRIGEVSNVIVKPISPMLPPVPSVRGMTLLGDGSLAAVVDLSTLIDVLDNESHGIRIADLANEQAELPRIIVADDSLSVRRALTELMEDAGYEVAPARDGLEALEMINAKMPALVLLDLEMPKLNGLEVTRFLRSRAQTRRVPVVMITSRASEKYRTQADEAGVTLMLGKPYSEDELIVSVRRLMHEHTQLAAMENS